MADTNFKMTYDMLVYGALILVVLIVFSSVLVFTKIGRENDSETSRLWLASGMFSRGHHALRILRNLVLHCAGRLRGPEIFDKGLIVIATLAGLIVGYCFGAAPSGRQDAEALAQNEITRPPIRTEPVKKEDRIRRRAGISCAIMAVVAGAVQGV